MLKADLLKALTPDQRGKMAHGEIVEVSLHVLPAALQQRATNYIVLAVNEMRKGLPTFPKLDSARGFSLQLRPEPGLSIGIIGYAAGGERWGF